MSLSITQAADLLGCHRVTVYRQIRKGSLRAYRVGRKWFITEDALAAYVGGERVLACFGEKEKAGETQDGAVFPGSVRR